jgi:hypothetical protein
MAVTNQELFNIFLANPNMSDAQIVSLMETRGISPEQVSSTFNIPLADVESRYNAALPFVNPQIEERVIDMGEGTRSEYYIKGTNIQADAPTFSETASTTGLTESSAPELKANNITIYDPQAKGEYVYTPEGKLIGFNPGERDSSFGGFLNEVYQDNKGVIIPALTFGALSSAGLLSGAAGTAGTAGLTTAELAQLDLALGGAGGTLGAETLASALATGATVPTLTNLTGASNAGTLGVTGANGAFLGEGVLSGVPASDAALANATVGATGLTQAQIAQLNTSVGGTNGLLTPPVVTPPAVVPPTVVPPAVMPPAVVPPAVVPPVIPPVIPPVADLVKAGLTATQIAQLLATTAQTASGLLQQQTSKEAADKAREMIDRETASAKAAAQFRPIGMTTRFGTSQFKVDPVTGQLTSAGYTLSPEAKAAQDQFAKLAEYGITQAKEAQGQFAPLQTGAQSLFGLGNQYLAQSPQDVAQNYLNQQMQLLQPGRELELANLQNRLQQQGRGGLSVAQGGTLGATTPELQALFNARAQQEAQLAANAQQFGQQQVTFGAGLLNQGAQTMGQYYGGQQAAYAPYTTAMGQVTGLETAAQQPFQMGVDLGKISASTGFDAGRLGLQGAGQSVALATGPAATNNPYASLLSGAASSPALTEATAKAILGLFS